MSNVYTTPDVMSAPKEENVSPEGRPETKTTLMIPAFASAHVVESRHEFTVAFAKYMKFICIIQTRGRTRDEY
ncbi:hypothetical protein Hypma_002311 [Hypsizygus marmoreus]|uniref:Uncharacterized protein n=1 Tax=Hypsizygus marmoreus TaxID=39966 RepID=A0A369K320_HYPMA|nr:hypothetical protein Hypma_002311 [Hypsizygus marmoreus]